MGPWCAQPSPPTLAMRRRGIRRRPWAALLAVAAVAACSAAPDPRVTLVDDWSVGTERSCPGAECLSTVDAATEGLAGRDPGHAAVVRVTVHDDGLYPCRNTGDLIQVFRSGGFPTIVLFELADGSHRAIGVVAGGPQFSLQIPLERGPGPQECTRTEPHATT